ncbi:AraC family transcriptional regulator [Actinomadura rupiterrae]|uniref:AraC family transcriptional regulator n=1 Tax=Actinomadura rupiterrae TaxID=559627 RepID=UPI0020A25DDE|nr:AraC family transcriptional regulator [Actinomadura rupiterrae]MCP2343629.1 AraC-like DNA-binding protein [Actinomadura rupiterrae]
MEPGTSGSVSTHIARFLLQAAADAGVEASAIAAVPGLAPAMLGGDLDRVSTLALHRLWELIHAAAGPEAGVRIAAAAEHGRLHVWDYLVTGAPTLAEGFGDAARYFAALTDPQVTLQVTEGDGRLSVGYAGFPLAEDVNSQINEFALALLLRRARESAWGVAVPVHVAFAHRAPRRHGHLVEAFGTRAIDFGADADTVTFADDGRLTRERPHDPELRRIMRQYAQSVIDGARPVPTWQDAFHAAVCDVLAECLPDGVSLERVARRMAVSPRTLQRRLAEQGTSWREEVEAVRHRQAARLLRDTRLPVRSIAGRLGYTDPRTLRRAFLRWTGQTPDAYRRTV